MEGNTDVLALRQAGFEPVVASMGTALTERQLKELGRLTTRVWLCFDGDAAGEAATLRGMELAAAQRFDVHVVALPAGLDPADLADGFDRRLAGAESYLGYRVRLEIERARRPAGSVRARARGARAVRGLARAPGRHPLRRRQARPAEGDAGRARAAQCGVGDRPRLAAAARRGRAVGADSLAGVCAHRSLVPILAELGPEHFDAEEHRKLRAQLVSGGESPEDLVGLFAELDALAASEGIDERTAEELLLRLRERHLRRELSEADPARTLRAPGGPCAHPRSGRGIRRLPSTLRG